MVIKTLGPKIIKNLTKNIVGKRKDYAPQIAAPKKPSDTKLDLEKGKQTGKASTTAPVMFHKSREVIVDAPFENNQAGGWLNYIKQQGVRDLELNDTSLKNYLTSLGNDKITKQKLLQEFDEIAPSIDVVPLGKPSAINIISNLTQKLRKIDPDRQDPRVGGLVKYLNDALPSVGASSADDFKSLESVVGSVDNYMQKAFGIEGAMAKGINFDAPVPFTIKEIVRSLGAATGQRTKSFSPSAYAKEPSYGGQQTLSGGDNYREFLFKYKPGKLRQTEPTYSYSHDFGLQSGDRTNGFVHTRVSDRTDEFGRRILFVEEIQSDMHQNIQRSMREAAKTGRTLNPDYSYALRGDLPPPKELIANKQQLDLINLKIENLNATNPRSPALNKLYEEREKIRNILAEARQSSGISGGSIPEGPYQNSADYMQFVTKYLLRVAKDSGYDGLAFPTPQIKNLNLRPGDRSYQGNLAAYGPMLDNALKKVSKKVGTIPQTTVIKTPDGRVFRIKFLDVKNNKDARSNIAKGTPAYKEGGYVNHGR